MRVSHFQWLLNTGQQAKAGEVRVREGKLTEAMELFVKGGAPARAAKVRERVLLVVVARLPVCSISILEERH